MIDLDRALRPPAPEGWPACRSCGCWQHAACWDEEAGACWWVEPDLCSHCAGDDLDTRSASVLISDL